MLFYNTHQPSSNVHPFRGNAKIQFCKHMLRHAISEHSARQNSVGFLFGGDPNCMQQPWTTAFLEEPSHRVHFQEPSFIYANEDVVANPTNAKDGDMALVAGIQNLKGRQFDLHLQSREKAHDVILIGWSITGKITHEPRALLARKWVQQKRARHAGASEHSSSSAPAGASEHAIEPPAIPVDSLTDPVEELPEASVDWGEQPPEEEKQAEKLDGIGNVGFGFRIASSFCKRGG